MNDKDIIDLNQCKQLYFLNKINVQSKKELSYALKVAIGESIKNKKYDIAFLNSLLDDSLFISEDAKKEEINVLSKKLERYMNFLNSRTIEMHNISREIVVNGVPIVIKADLVIKHCHFIEIVKIKRTAPKLSMKARIAENLPKNNMELYLLWLLGEELIKEKYNDCDKVVSSFHHLSAKEDKNNMVNSVFFPEQIISSSWFSEEVKEKLQNLVGLKPMQEKIIEEKKECQTCRYKNICFYKRPQAIELKKIKKLTDYDKIKLTPSQHSAVMFEKGITRINAGAGSGKTTVVAIRVTELINRGYKPEDILLITFTNKGTEEMREKIKYWLEKEKINIDINRFNIMTFNSWGKNIIEENYAALGFTEIPTLIDKVAKYDIIFQLLKNKPNMEGYNYKNPLINFRYSKGVIIEIDNAFDYIKGHYIVRLSDFKKEYTRISNHEEIYNMYLEYMQILKKENYIEYQDQVNLVVKFIEEIPELLEKYNYKHLIIDEYQDSDKMQLDLILFLSNQPAFKSLMVVGDDSQSIYGFRNTSQEIILNFHQYFEKVKDINMVDNFRSTEQIVDLANAINDLNENRIKKDLKSNKKQGKEPLLAIFNNLYSEYLYIVDDIEKRIKNFEKPENIAVIARTKSELFQIAEMLKILNVPYVIDVPEPLLNNVNIHIIKNLGQFIIDNNNDLGLLEYLAITKDLSEMSIEDIKELVANEKTKFAIEKELLGKEPMDWFFNKANLIDDKDFKKFIDMLKEKNFNSMNELTNYLEKFILYEDKKTIEKPIDKFSAVTLTTAHTSKGKEFDIVYNTINKYDKDNIDEERRLLFVSITRAKKELIITYQSRDKTLCFKENVFANEIAKTKKAEIFIASH